MRKYLRGAYKPLDAVMTFLSSRELAYRRDIEWGHRTQYFLTGKGCQAVEGLSEKWGIRPHLMGLAISQYPYQRKF